MADYEERRDKRFHEATIATLNDIEQRLGMIEPADDQVQSSLRYAAAYGILRVYVESLLANFAEVFSEGQLAEIRIVLDQLRKLVREDEYLDEATREKLDQLAQVGTPAERTILLGFSQGACLALEYTARNARRYGGTVGLSGGLIGPDGTPRDYPGSLAGTPVFLGCSDMDPHIPKERVEQSAGVLRLLGGNVTMRLYPHMDHTVNQDELNFVQGMIASVLPIGN